MFITFEGIDGSGKSTQLTLLAGFLREQGHTVLETRDPGGMPLGRELREILLHHPGEMSSRCELLLYLADRAQHVDEVIQPALALGHIVLCDRYLDSTLAYQGGGRGLPMADIRGINAIASAGLMPDLTFWFDAPVPVLLKRAKNRSDADRLERETESFFERIRQAYTDLAQAEPQRIKRLDATQSIESIQDALRQQLASAFTASSPR